MKPHIWLQTGRVPFGIPPMSKSNVLIALTTVSGIIASTSWVAFEFVESDAARTILARVSFTSLFSFFIAAGVWVNEVRRDR